MFDYKQIHYEDPFVFIKCGGTNYILLYCKKQQHGFQKNLINTGFNIINAFKLNKYFYLIEYVICLLIIC